MKIQTHRFGEIEVDGDRVITFPDGLLGFAEQTKYVLVQRDENSAFWWLQSTEQADVAFVVTDPRLHFPEWDFDGRDGYDQVFVIVNKHGSVMTANLKGPLYVNTKSLTGKQLVIGNDDLSTQTPMMAV